MIARTVLAIALACLPAVHAAARLQLTDLPIVLPPAASPTERFAAEELSRYLQAITGKPFAIRESGGNGLLIGRRLAQKAGVAFSTERYGGDGFLLRRTGSTIYLAGIEDRATLYAVYAFLELLGARWHAPNFDFYGAAGGEFIPHNPSAGIEDLDRIEKPAMAWRKKYVEEGISHTAANLAQMVDWMAKARLNVLNCPIDYQHHGRVRWDNWREALIPELRKRGLLIEVGGHGYPNFLPVGKYFDAHPEWFGMVGGRRTRAENVVFSTANTDAVNAYIANVTDYLKQRPEIDIFDAWPPDGARWSEAPEDVALGKPAERHGLLVKQLAGALAGSLPRVRLQFIAYATYIEPPASTRFPANVLMEYCPINRSFESPLFDSASAVNTQYFGHLTEWLKRTIDPSQVTLYSYITKYGWRSLPILIPRMIASEVRRFAEMGIGGLATYSEPGAWATFEIDHYMAARAIWNPKLDADAEIGDYVKTRYGKAAEPVLAYLNLVEAIVPHAVGIPGTDLQLDRQKQLISRFGEARKHLERARQLVKDTPGELLVDKLETSRQYAENEMRIRLAFLQNSSSGRSYAGLEELLAARRHLLEENRSTGVILTGRD